MVLRALFFCVLSNFLSACSGDSADENTNENVVISLDIADDNVELVKFSSLMPGNEELAPPGDKAFYIFSAEKAVLSIVAVTDDSLIEPVFSFDSTLYLFPKGTTVDGLNTWIQNQNTDALMPAPSPSAEISLNDIFTETGYQLTDAGATRDVYLVSYSFDNYEQDNVELEAFSGDMVVSVYVSRLENYWNWMGFGYKNTQVFYSFEPQRMVLEIDITGIPIHGQPVFDIGAKVHLFEAGGEGSVASWANNQFSDHIMLDPATPSDTIVVAEGDYRVTTVGDPVVSSIVDGVNLYSVGFELDGGTYSGVTIPAFMSTATVAVEPLDSSEVVVYINTGATQCNSDGLSLTDAQSLLRDVNVVPTNNLCGDVTGVSYAAVCGGQTGGFYAFSINVSDLGSAQAQGFDDVETLVDTSTGLGYALSVCPGE